jgi:predicted amidophosphoribosyltransferase
LQLIVISKSLILKFKHADRLELTTIVSTLLSPAFNQLCNPDTLVIPIPLHPARYRKLMFNQSSEIARSLCKTYECTPLYQPSLLERVVNTEQLGRMRRSQRAKTLKGVFTINHQKQNLLISKSCLRRYYNQWVNHIRSSKKTFECRCLTGKCALFCKRALIDNIQLSSRLI